MRRATAAGCSESTAGSASSGGAGESCSASRATSSSSSSCTPRPTSSTRTPAGARWRNSRGNCAWKTPRSRPARPTCSCGSTISMGLLRPGMLRVLNGFLAVSVALFASVAAAQYPSKPIRLLVPIPPGGGPDLVGRLIAARLSETLGQPVVVENRVGGNGEVAAMMSGTSTAPQIKAGRLRVLAYTGPKRSGLLPEVPTIAETYPDFEMTQWYGLFAPPATPEAVLARLRAEVSRILNEPEIRERLHNAGGVEAWITTPGEFATAIRNAHAKYARLVREIGARID